jgi:hypothetical protein
MAKNSVYMKDKSGFVFETSFPQYNEDCERLTAAEGKAAIIAQTKEELRKVYPVGALVQTQLLHVSSSGMSRRISVLACVGGVVRRMDNQVAEVIGLRVSDSGGIIMGGCGMDMGFSIAYSLGRALYPDGFGGYGQKVNKETGKPEGRKLQPKTKRAAAAAVKRGYVFRGRNGDPSGWDRDGGYALAHQWL